MSLIDECWSLARFGFLHPIYYFLKRLQENCQTDEIFFSLPLFKIKGLTLFCPFSRQRRELFSMILFMSGPPPLPPPLGNKSAVMLDCTFAQSSMVSPFTGEGPDVFKKQFFAFLTITFVSGFQLV